MDWMHQLMSMEACPFCGEPIALSVGEVLYEEPWFMVFCQICGAEGPQSESEEKALYGWNTRANPTEKNSLRDQLS